jgi:phosphoglycolate phosphatase-like HAD superfamily hydrolase
VIEYRRIIDNAWIRESSIDRFKSVECVIFDCDGTLVDINDSYNACIKHTAGLVLERMLGGRDWYSLVSDEIILRFRLSGGFNNDIDTTYASVLSAVASKTNKIEVARKFVLDAASHADERGIISVEQHLTDMGFGEIVGRVKNELKYPGLTGFSPLSTMFDEFFYGRDLFMKMNGIEPLYNNSNGFIDKDKVLISLDKLAQMHSMFDGKLAIVSGRSKLATEYSLKPFLQYFNLSASVFIEDEEKRVMNENLDLLVGKPHPYALIRSAKALNVSTALCTGDSVEDMLMAKKASESEFMRTVFCGIYGSVKDGDTQLKVFKDRNADAIIENINMLPNLLTALRH